MSPDDKDSNTDKQNNREREQPILQVNATTFGLVARGSDYILYQAREQRRIGNIAVDIFLEHVSHKGWWGAMRFNGRFRIQLSLDRATLFPTPEIALLATEEFLADKQRVRETLTDMHKEKRDLQTFYHVPPRPADVDAEKYFSPVLLKVRDNIFTLYHLTNTEAAYRTWEQKVVAEIAVDLHLAHIYGKGWQAGVRFPGARAVMFEPEIDQLFLTPETALETLLAFCSEEESVRKLAQRLAETHAQDRIVLRNEVVPLVTTKTALQVDNVDFVWQKQMSEGQLYQAKRAQFVHFTKVHLQLVETWRRGWLGGLQFKGIAGIYFEKEIDVGFPTPEAALAATCTFVALQEGGLRILRSVHHDEKVSLQYRLGRDEKVSLQCRLGRYDQIISIRTTDTNPQSVVE